MKKLSIIFLISQIILFGCSHDEKTFESGYDDGYACLLYTSDAADE